MSEYAVDLRLHIRFGAIRPKVIRAQQHIAKIWVNGAGSRTADTRERGIPSDIPSHRDCRWCQEGRSNHQSNRPDQKAMSHIAKINLVGMDDRPSCAQASCNIATDGKGENLTDN